MSQPDTVSPMQCPPLRYELVSGWLMLVPVHWHSFYLGTDGLYHCGFCEQEWKGQP